MSMRTRPRPIAAKSYYSSLQTPQAGREVIHVSPPLHSLPRACSSGFDRVPPRRPIQLRRPPGKTRIHPRRPRQRQRRESSSRNRTWSWSMWWLRIRSSTTSGILRKRISTSSEDGAEQTITSFSREGGRPILPRPERPRYFILFFDNAGLEPAGADVGTRRHGEIRGQRSFPHPHDGGHGFQRYRSKSIKILRRTGIY